MSQILAKDARKGTYIMLDGEPCEVRSTSKSSPGKHGSAKMKIKARGLFDGNDRIEVRPADKMVDQPQIEKKAGRIVSIQGRTAQVMDLETYETEELTLPEDMDETVENGDELKYWLVNDRVLVKDVRKDTD
jgi:translation initiation factor 5A